jgi:hypothetical protein
MEQKSRKANRNRKDSKERKEIRKQKALPTTYLDLADKVPLYLENATSNEKAPI